MKRYKDIQGYRGRYRIYEDWRIWSAWGKKFKKRRISKDGYVVTVLWNKRAKSVKCKWFSIHRLLYLYFIGKIPKGKQINHKNGIKTDNRIENLALMTPEDHCHHHAIQQIRKTALNFICQSCDKEFENWNYVKFRKYCTIDCRKIRRKSLLHDSSKML